MSRLVSKLVLCVAISIQGRHINNINYKFPLCTDKLAPLCFLHCICCVESCRCGGVELQQSYSTDISCHGRAAGLEVLRQAGLLLRVCVCEVDDSKELYTKSLY